jgi:prepilin-type processing-associated H-X9-DG protein
MNYAIKSPSADIGLTASTPYWPTNTSDGAAFGGITNNTPWQGWEARHNSMCNFGFVDGHAKALSLNVLGGGGHVNYLDATDKVLTSGFWFG